MSKIVKYEVVGLLKKVNCKYVLGYPFIQGKKRYPRIIIKKLNIIENE